jgi:hypothetical protein
MAARETLMISLRERFAEYGVAREAMLSVGITVRQARRLWDGQARLTPQVLNCLRPLLSTEEFCLLMAAGDGMPSVLDALNAVEPVHASEYWITPTSIDLAETGLDAWAAYHMGLDGETHRTDAVQVLLRTHGYIAVCRTGDGPILIDWSTTVDPLALRHLRRALGQWGAAAGYRFGTDLARRQAMPTLREALHHVDQALALRGHRQDASLHIDARALTLDAGQGRLKLALNLWQQSLDHPRGIAAFPRDVLEHGVVYHLTEQGLVTAAIGRNLPLLFGVDKLAIVGQRTQAEPTPRPYLNMILAHVSEAVTARKPLLHHIRVCKGELDVSYHRLTVPVLRNRKVVAALTVTDAIRGLDG